MCCSTMCNTLSGRPDNHSSRLSSTLAQLQYVIVPPPHGSPLEFVSMTQATCSARSSLYAIASNLTSPCYYGSPPLHDRCKINGLTTNYRFGNPPYVSVPKTTTAVSCSGLSLAKASLHCPCQWDVWSPTPWKLL